MSPSPFNRREFLRGTLASAVAPGVVMSAAGLARARQDGAPSPAPGPNGRPPAGTPMGGRLKIGVVGCGGRGTGAILQALAADQNSVLHAMGDIFPERLEGCLKAVTEELGEAAGARLDVPPERRYIGIDAYKQVIASGVDVVLLTSYPHFRPAHLEAAIAAGKHVFAEKPLAVDAPGLRRVREACAQAEGKGLSLVVGFCWRYGDAERAVFQKLHEGTIGDVLSVHTTYHTTTLSKRPRKPEWSDMEFQLRNWWHFTWVSGDHIVEQAVHSIDRLAWAMKDATPARCVCLGGRAARSGEEHGNAFDHFGVVYEYADGRRAFHTCRQQDGCPSDNSDYITCERGLCEVNGWKPVHALRDRAGKTLWSYDAAAPGGVRRDMYQNEHDVLFQSIREGLARNDGAPANPWAVNSTMLAIMARMAAYTGQTISWEQAWESTEDLTPASYAFGALPMPSVAVPGKTKFA